MSLARPPRHAPAAVTRRGMLTVAVAATGPSLARPSLAQARFPGRPVQLICPWAAGGGTDAIARLVAALLEKELGQPVGVVNRTGGYGAAGHAAIALAPPDGHTIGVLTLEIATMHWMGLTHLTPRSYTPLALVNEDPAGVQVNAAAPWRDIRVLAEAIKAAPPGRLMASGTGQGGSWHLALVGWLRAMGLRGDHVRWLPSDGAAPALQQLAAGRIDVVPCSLPEARATPEAGRVRSLAVMAPGRDPMFADVPTLRETLGIDHAAGVWRGVAGPPGLPEEARRTLGAALGRACMASREYRDAMQARGFGVVFADAAGFRELMDRSDRALGEALRAVGLVRGLEVRSP
jgi:tripartite-type tricarboxylate transporter receptor subunit TctC